jgi:hypothetical protein
MLDLITHTTDTTPAADHGVAPCTMAILFLAAYFHIPEWYVMQVVHILIAHSVRLLRSPALALNLVRVHLIAPMARVPGEAWLLWQVGRHH